MLCMHEMEQIPAGTLPLLGHPGSRFFTGFLLDFPTAVPEEAKGSEAQRMELKMNKCLHYFSKLNALF